MRITLAVDDRTQDPLARHPGDVGNHRVKPHVHLCERFLHVQYATRAVLGQPLRLADVRAQRTNRVTGPEGPAQQPVRKELPDPLAVQDVALAPRDLLRHPRRHQHHLEAGPVQDLVDRDPVHRGRLHRHLLHPAGRQPCRHLLQVRREGIERPHRFLAPVGIDRDVVRVLADVDTGAVRVHDLQAFGLASSLAGHVLSSSSSLASLGPERNHG